jgi:hypothetical protein
MTLGKPEVVYTVALSGRGTPAGAPAGRGYAIIALHHRSILCFRFAHLHGFTIATKAVMYTGAHPGRGSFYLTPGPRLHHQGCIRLTPATWSAVHTHASAYTVEIDSAKYLAGAVRARLSGSTAVAARPATSTATRAG